MGGNGFLGTSGHRQMMNPSVMNLQHRLVLELSVGLSFDQRQAQWRIDLFRQQLQALSALSCRSLARNLYFRGIRSRLALKVEGLARVSKNAGGRPRLASVAFDGRYMGLAL